MAHAVAAPPIWDPTKNHSDRERSSFFVNLHQGFFNTSSDYFLTESQNIYYEETFSLALRVKLT